MPWKISFREQNCFLGKKQWKSLPDQGVAVFGIGGVGGYTTEALVRSGIGEIDLIDSDRVSLTNLNRQIIALRSTVGKYKVDIMQERIMDINPDIKVHVHKCFYLPETKDQFDFSKYDYVVDAVDTVTAKIQLVMEAKEAEEFPLSAAWEQAISWILRHLGLRIFIKLPYVLWQR